MDKQIPENIINRCVCRDLCRLSVLFLNHVLDDKIEDGESYEYEVEADTFADATKQAENFAMDLMVDITYIECYCM